MIFPIFFTILINFIGLTIILPVFGPLLLDIQYGFLPNVLDPGTRVTILTLLIACYPTGQFFGSPILGTLSDHYGRKKMLMIGLFGSSFGFFISGLAITLKSIALLVTGRLLAGLCAGTIAISYSAISDITEGFNRARYFSIVTLAIGLGWILGPLIGGNLSQIPLALPMLNTYSMPFVLGTVLSLLNCIWVYFGFKETLKNRKKARITLLIGFRNIVKAIKMPKINKMFCVWFFFMFGWAQFMQFFSPYMVQTFKYGKNELGIAYTLFGTSYALAQIFITRVLAKKFLEEQIIKPSLAVLMILVPAVLFYDHPWVVVGIFCFMALCVATIIPNCISLITKLARSEGQGEILGINQSVQSIAWILPPVFMSIFKGYSIKLPFFFSATSFLLGLTLFAATFGNVKFVRKKIND